MEGALVNPMSIKVEMFFSEFHRLSPSVGDSQIGCQSYRSNVLLEVDQKSHISFGYDT